MFKKLILLSIILLTAVLTRFIIQAPLTLTSQHPIPLTTSTLYTIPITATGSGINETIPIELLVGGSTTYLPLIVR